MTIDTTTTAEPAPFQRLVAVAGLSEESETPFRISAEADELVALAGYLDVDRIDRFSLAGFIAPTATGGWRVRGRLVAKLEQSCVVTLTPVYSRHNVDIERIYLPADQIAPDTDVQFSHDDQDLPDSFTDNIDMAQLAIESLALLIDPFPRAEGATLDKQTFAAPGVTPLSDEAASPFAALAALKSASGSKDS